LEPRTGEIPLACLYSRGDGRHRYEIMHMRVATELQEVLLRLEMAKILWKLPAKYVFGGMYLEGLLGRTPSSTAILFLFS
jgi:hypothetical protein